jgi:hypothetical protein
MYKFIGKQNWKDEYIIPDTRGHFEKYAKFYGKVEILRPLWFFHEGQQGITLKDLLKFYQDQAIYCFINDGFITIEELNSKGEVSKND